MTDPNSPTLPEKAQPVIQIETPRLRLRTIRQDDFNALWMIFTDPNVMAAFQSPPLTREQMYHWLQRNLDHQRQHGFGLFSVLLQANNLLIGNCGLEIMEVDGAVVAELGYDFHSDHWRQGYASEAATAVRDYAFQTLHLPRLISLIRVGNQGSKRVAEKIGMHRVEEYSTNGRAYWRYELVATNAPFPATNVS